MRAFGTVVGLVLALGGGYFVLQRSVETGPKPSPPQEQIDLVGIRQQLLAVGQAERQYLVAHGTYGTLEQLAREELLPGGTEQRGWLANARRQREHAAHAALARHELDSAEGEGFEPPEPFRVQRFSRPPPSTTRPSLRVEITPESARSPGGDTETDHVSLRVSRSRQTCQTPCVRPIVPPQSAPADAGHLKAVRRPRGRPSCRPDARTAVRLALLA